jgi:phage shock protein PspC (stress-responsive transcriptional regulator)
MSQTGTLYRSRADKILFGVCGGLAKYFDLDASLFRVLFVLLTLANGLGIIVYLAMAILVPLEPGETVAVNRGDKIKDLAAEVGAKTKSLAAEMKFDQSKKIYSRNAIGTVIIIIGVILLLKQVAPFMINWINWGVIWPVLIILLGLYLVFMKKSA